MKPFPFHRQPDSMDCGPTCLQMIAKHYGKSFSLQTLREKSQIGKEGVSMLGISEAAESIGFRTQAVKLKYESLAAKYPMNGKLKQQDAKIEAMRKWCDGAEIIFTPTIFVNGHRLPENYNVEELKNILFDL